MKEVNELLEIYELLNSIYDGDIDEIKVNARFKWTVYKKSFWHLKAKIDTMKEKILDLECEVECLIHGSP